ncbi:hypothetical protein CDAR_611801 [Caerostris darwini]|uniref:Uncharacterized protein n=1 Tax=Caerostris darwini TaxID=1538125 RepID=A0AAV4MTW2_9ARAC|nr:hypothetical protein CDAR_611801 [Caerostris darwini]
MMTLFRRLCGSGSGLVKAHLLAAFGYGVSEDTRQQSSLWFWFWVSESSSAAAFGYGVSEDTRQVRGRGVRTLDGQLVNSLDVDDSVPVGGDDQLFLNSLHNRTESSFVNSREEKALKDSQAKWHCYLNNEFFAVRTPNFYHAMVN